VVVACILASCNGATPTAFPATPSPIRSAAVISPSPSAPTETHGPAPSAAAGPLTDAEIAALTGGAQVAIPPDAPAPVIDAAAAEAIARATYGGRRTTIGRVRVAMALPAGLRTGWFVALAPADGESCALHAGLLARAIEGGVVDDQTADMFWVFACGP
jgi:hypothetical protein